MQTRSDKEVGRVMRTLQDMGLKIEYGGICRELILRHLDLDNINPGQLVAQVKNLFSFNKM